MATRNHCGKGPRTDRIMSKFGYWLGVGLLVAAAAAALAEFLTMLQGAPATLSIGAIWFRINANSLVGFQALIEKGASPAVWPPIQWLLTLPTWLVLAPPGLLLVLLCRSRTRG
jgi:FtsH-binding integral membrane protein